MKYEGPLVLQKVSGNGPVSGKGCVNLFFLASIHRWAGSDYLSRAEQRCFSLPARQRGRVLGRQAIMYDFNSKSNKNQVKRSSSNVKLELTLPCNTTLPCNIEVEKE